MYIEECTSVLQHATVEDFLLKKLETDFRKVRGGDSLMNEGYV